MGIELWACFVLGIIVGVAGTFTYIFYIFDDDDDDKGGYV